MMEVNGTPRAVIVAADKLVMRYVAAHPTNYSRAVRKPSVIVLHCTDGHEGTTKDTDAAIEISKPLPKGKERSFHFVVDADSATACVEPKFTAWHARKHGNAVGIGIEICGSADQTRAQWLDALSLATLQITARLCAELCRDFAIPPVALSEAGLRAGLRGITTHHIVSQAWKESTHYDPGPHFPFADFLEAVAVAVEAMR